MTEAGKESQREKMNLWKEVRGMHMRTPPMIGDLEMEEETMSQGSGAPRIWERQ